MSQELYSNHSLPLCQQITLDLMGQNARAFFVSRLLLLSHYFAVGFFQLRQLEGLQQLTNLVGQCVTAFCFMQLAEQPSITLHSNIEHHIRGQAMSLC